MIYCQYLATITCCLLAKLLRNQAYVQLNSLLTPGYLYSRMQVHGELVYTLFYLSSQRATLSSHFKAISGLSNWFLLSTIRHNQVLRRLTDCGVFPKCFKRHLDPVMEHLLRKSRDCVK